MNPTRHKLYLAFVRHGEYKQKPNVPSACQPYALTNIGSEQALESAIQIQKFADEHACAIDPTLISSTLLRAWQTADYIGKGLHIPYQIEQNPKLSERSMGSMANLTVEEIEAAMAADPRHPAPPKDWKSDSHYCLPYLGAESLLQSGERVAHEITQTFHQLTATAQQDTLKIMVGHGASFRHAAYCLGILNFDEIRGLSMFYGVPVFFEYDPSQTQSWSKAAGEWKIRQTSVIDCPTID